MRKFGMILVVAAGLLAAGSMVSATASAQDAKKAPAKAPAAGGDSGTTTYNFDDDLVTGDLVRPDGEILSARGLGKRSSLITIREHFVPEMLKSVEDL